MSALGSLLRQLREQAGLTQEELAGLAAVSARTISDTERGVRRRLYPDTAGRLAAGLRLDGAAAQAFIEAARNRTPPGTRGEIGLPHPLTALVDRKEELEALVGDLWPAGHRLVTVTGLGGVGKTRLALAAAEQLALAYDGRVSMVQLVDGSDAARLVDDVASALGAVPSAIAAAVAGRPSLVLLDAFEHVLPAAESLGDALAIAPELQVLVTSRERLGVTGERVLVLDPLPSDAAVRLFLDRVHDLESRAAEDPAVVAEICSLVSDLPLSVELAAAHVRYLPLDLLRDRLRAGLTDARRVVEQAVAWSVSSLTVEQRAVLTGAAMFEAGWRLDALQAVCGENQAVCGEVDVIAALGALADRSLVQLDPGGHIPRWRMLDVVREIAAGLDPDTELRDRAYLQYYLRLLDEVSRDLGHERNWYQVLAAEEPNIRRALTSAERAGDATALLSLATGMWLFWQARGGLAEGRRWLTAGLDLRPSAEPSLRASALWGRAWLTFHQADDDAAESAARELEVLARGLGDPAIRRNADTIAGMVAIARDRPDDAVARLTRAVETSRTLDQPLGPGHVPAESGPRSPRHRPAPPGTNHARRGAREVSRDR